MPGVSKRLEVLQKEKDALLEELRRRDERLGLGDQYVPLYEATNGIPELDKFLDLSIVAAVIAHHGNAYGILKALDFPVHEMGRAQQTSALAGLLARPGVREGLSDEAKALAKIKALVVARHTDIALFGDPVHALGSANFLARLAGWNAPTKVDMSGKITTYNAFELLSNPDIMRALKLINHEPGEALAIKTEATEGLTIEQEAVE